MHLGLHAERINQHQHTAEDDRNDHRPGNPRHDSNEDKGKRDVNKCRNCGRSDEIPNSFEGTQIGSKGTHRRRPVLHAHAQYPLHDAGRQLDIDALAGPIKEITAHRAQDEITDDDQRHAETHHPQGLYRLVGHDAVIDIHRKERQRQRKYIDEECGQHDIAVDAAILRQHPPEPMLQLDCTDRWRPLIKAVFGLDYRHMTVITAFQLLDRQCNFRLTDRGKNHPGMPARIVPSQQQADTFAFEQ